MPALGHALAGSVGTAIANLSIYPLDLIITRLQVQRTLRASSNSVEDANEYQGVLDACQKIYKNEGGVKAFYVGVLQDTGKSIADSFLFFLFYNYLRTRRLQKNGTKSTTLPALEELIVGALAGACSKFFTTPISNIVTRKQTAPMHNSHSSAPGSTRQLEPTVTEIYDQIKSAKGYQGFWSGYSASLVLTLNPSLTFFLYEFFKRTTLPRSRRDDPGARTTFLMAAFAKACASTVTYPFSLAKARAQAESKPPVESSATRQVESDVRIATSRNSSNEEKEAKVKDAANTARTIAKKNNVFTEILKIYRTEGPAALYEGVYGEILKGFFSHGITMLVKEAIHKLIIKAYFMILKALNRFPSPTEMAGQVESKVKEGVEGAQAAVSEGIERTRSVAGGVTEKGQEALQNGYAKAGEAVEALKERIEPLGERAGVLGSNAATVGQNVSEGTQKAAASGFHTAQENAKSVVETAKEKISGVTGNQTSNGQSISKTAKGSIDEAVEKAGKVVGVEELKSEDAGHLLGNAQEMLGDQVVKVGEGIKGKGENE